MKLKSFREHLEKRLSKDDIAEIENQAKLEIKALEFMQSNIADAVHAYMEKNNIGFNELARRLDKSPTQLAKIQRGEANLTLASIAHLCALIGEEPHSIFKKS